MQGGTFDELRPGTADSATMRMGGCGAMSRMPTRPQSARAHFVTGKVGEVSAQMLSPRGTHTRLQERPQTARPASAGGPSPRAARETGPPKFGTRRFEEFVEGEASALRFYSYFTERTDWVPGQLGMPDQISEFVRKCVILFYPQDDTLAIFEERAPNSGIPGGVFYKVCLWGESVSPCSRVAVTP